MSRRASGNFRILSAFQAALKAGRFLNLRFSDENLALVWQLAAEARLRYLHSDSRQQGRQKSVEHEAGNSPHPL